MLAASTRRHDMTSYDLGMYAKPKFAMTQFTVEEFCEFWPELERMMDAVPHTWPQWTKEYVCDSVVTNRLQVWGIGAPPRATLVFFTTISVMPSMRVFNVVWGAGTFE